MEHPHTSTNDYPAVSGAAPEIDNSASESLSKEQQQRLFQQGLKWLGAGIVLMAVSFGINFFLFDSHGSFQISMYVLTSVGSICIFKGLVDIPGF